MTPDEIIQQSGPRDARESDGVIGGGVHLSRRGGRGSRFGTGGSGSRPDQAGADQRNQ